MSGPIKTMSSIRIVCVFVPSVEMYPKHRPMKTTNAVIMIRSIIEKKLILSRNINNFYQQINQCVSNLKTLKTSILKTA